MSKRIIFGTCIKDADRLRMACDAMRERHPELQGPDKIASYPHPRNANKQISGEAVKLPGWRSQAVFTCNDAGEMVADNYSDYYDERQIDTATGERLTGTGRVHPAVESGQKRVGEDGRWGNISMLEELQQEYTAAPLEAAVPKLGGRITYRGFEEETGRLLLTIEVPDEVASLYGDN